MSTQPQHMACDLLAALWVYTATLAIASVVCLASIVAGISGAVWVYAIFVAIATGLHSLFFIGRVSGLFGRRRAHHHTTETT